MSYVYTQLCVLWVATRRYPHNAELCRSAKRTAFWRLIKPRPSDIGGHASAGEGRADNPGDPLRAAT
jgi:hypothetical protein